MQIRNISHVRSRVPSGFSLVEILVVIAIVAGLAAIAFVAFGSANRSGMQAQAQADMRVIENAVERYYNEYGYLPPYSSGSSSSSDTRGETDGAASDLVKELSGADDTMNIKGINFLTLAEQASDSDNLSTDDDLESLKDPWGEFYQLILDSNYDNEIEPPAEYVGDTVRGKRILLWSLGADKSNSSDEERQDDVFSWK
jgi:prepilin-type N-terminal cleavage/methylation domain-containing protein